MSHWKLLYVLWFNLYLGSSPVIVGEARLISAMADVIPHHNKGPVHHLHHDWRVSQGFPFHELWILSSYALNILYWWWYLWLSAEPKQTWERSLQEGLGAFPRSSPTHCQLLNPAKRAWVTFYFVSLLESITANTSCEPQRGQRRCSTPEGWKLEFTYQSPATKHKSAWCYTGHKNNN